MNAEEVEFDPWGPLKVERSWTVTVDLPRKRIPEFCAALEDVMKTHRGGVFYFPRAEADHTRCRYDWFLPYSREVYGLRLTLVFDTNHDDVKEARVHLSLGPRLVNKTDVTITQRTERRILKGIQQVFAQASEIVEGKSDHFYPILYMKLPTGKWISTDADTEQGRIYRSAYNRRTGEVVSAVALRTLASDKGVARARALPIADKLTALMSLLADEPMAVVHPNLPKRGAFHTVQKEPPPISKVYPMSFHPCEPLPLLRDLREIALSCMRFLTDPALLNSEKLWQAIYAYATAQDVQKEHPTLASVAYVASLSTFSEPNMCGGEVTCSVCGTRPPHPVESESEGIVAMVIRELGLQSDSGKKEQVSRLVKAVHSKQRSAYVHDAVLRHQEEGNMKALLGRPGEQSHVSRELIFTEELRSIRDLARRVLLLKLPRTDLLESLIGESEAHPILSRIPLTAAITVGPRGVGFRLHPPETTD